MSDNKQVVSVLNDLLENSRDGEYGFKTCAEQVETASAKTLFATRAAGCAQAARELEAMIVQYGGKPADGGTTAGALHRGWVQAKGAVGFDSKLSISAPASPLSLNPLKILRSEAENRPRRPVAEAAVGPSQ